MFRSFLFVFICYSMLFHLILPFRLRQSFIFKNPTCQIYRKKIFSINLEHSTRCHSFLFIIRDFSIRLQCLNSLINKLFQRFQNLFSITQILLTRFQYLFLITQILFTRSPFYLLLLLNFPTRCLHLSSIIL